MSCASCAVSLRCCVAACDTIAPATHERRDRLFTLAWLFRAHQHKRGGAAQPLFLSSFVTLVPRSSSLTAKLG